MAFLDQRHNAQVSNTEFHLLLNIILTVMSHRVSSDVGL